MLDCHFCFHRFTICFHLLAASRASSFPVSWPAGSKARRLMLFAAASSLLRKPGAGAARAIGAMLFPNPR